MRSEWYSVTAALRSSFRSWRVDLVEGKRAFVALKRHLGRSQGVPRSDFEVATSTSRGPAKGGIRYAPNVNRDDNVTTDDAPGVSAASTAVAVVASQVATSVIRKGIAIPIASHYMAEQAYLAMTILALPAGGSTDLLKNGGDMSVGLAIMAAQYASVE